MGEIIPLPKVTRLNLIRVLLYYKRIIRLQLHRQNCHWDEIAGLNRHKRLLEAKNSPFDRNRIYQTEQRIELHREERKRGKVKLTSVGQLLIDLMVHADRVLSFHDKCQLLNISHTAALKALDGDKTVSFEKMIFVHALEYRGSEEMLPMDDISMPYWCAMYQRFLNEMKINQTLRLASTLVFDEMLSEGRQFQEHEKPAETEKMRKVSSNLRVVK